MDIIPKRFYLLEISVMKDAKLGVSAKCITDMRFTRIRFSQEPVKYR